MIRIIYENSERRIEPKSIEFTSTKWHPIPQWLLVAYDIDKQVIRRFALKDIKNWQDVIVADQESMLVIYQDNWPAEKLREWVGSVEELARINGYRDLKWTQEQFDLVITTAIKRQEEA